MSDRTHDYLAVERAMTPGERADMLDLWYRVNPHQRGAQVADVLDFLDSSDAHLDVVEPLEDEHREEYPGRPIGLCALAVVYAYNETERGTCGRCHGAGKTPGNALFPAQDPCGRCGGSGEADVPVARWERVEALLGRVILPGDAVRLAGGAVRCDEADLDAPVHAFQVTDGQLAELSLCGRAKVGMTDADPAAPVNYLDADLDGRCAWCDAAVSNLRALQTQVVAL